MVHFTLGITRIEGKDPPYDHNYLLGSAVYHLLNAHSEQASKILHDSPYRTAYVLSEIYRVSGKESESWFRLGTGDKRISVLLAKAMTPGASFKVGQTTFMIHHVTLNTPSAQPGEYITLSPVLLKDRETGRSVIHDSPHYLEVLQSAANAQVKKYLKKSGTVRILRFEALGVRKRTIDGRIVLAQKGRFLMEGQEDELMMLIDYGIGLSPALGFGMVVPTEGKYNE